MYIVDNEQVENIYNNIKNFEIYSFEGETIIDPSYDIGDILIIEGKKVIYQGESEYTGKFKANIKSKIQAKTEQESMQTKQNNINRIKRVQSEINQIDGKIKQLVQENAEHEDKITQVEQDVDGITQRVENMADTTRSTKGLTTIKLEKCIKGYLIKLRILGNNAVFKRLYPANDLYPSDTLYPLGDSRIIVTDEDGNLEMYELGVPDVLRANEEVQDEYILENNFAKVIRRVNEDGTTKETPTEEAIGKYTIYVFQGDNTITIQNYNASIEAVFVQQNAYTDQFATKVEMTNTIQQSAEQTQSKINKTLKDNYSTTQEMESTITQTAKEINTEVKKKVGEDEIISKINQSAETVGIEADKIELTANDILNLLAGNEINLGSKRITIKSDNFNVSEDGRVICSKILINSGTIDMKQDGTIMPMVKLSNNSGSYSYLQPGALQASDGTNETDITATDISTTTIYTINPVQYSKESLKTNIEKYEDNAINIVKNSDIYTYNFKIDKGAKKKIGFIIGDLNKTYNTPKEVISDDNEGINTYNMLSILWKAVQEQQEIIESMQNRENSMEEK